MTSPSVLRSALLAVSFLLLGGACATAQRRVHPRAVALQSAGVRSLVDGDLDRAAGQFSLALEFDPKMAEAHNGLGLVAVSRGDTSVAEARFREALAYNEELAEAHLNLGFIVL